MLVVYCCFLGCLFCVFIVFMFALRLVLRCFDLIGFLCFSGLLCRYCFGCLGGVRFGGFGDCVLHWFFWLHCLFCCLGVWFGCAWLSCLYGCLPIGGGFVGYLVYDFV